MFVVPPSGDSMCKLTGKLLTPSGPSRNGCPAGPQRMGQNWPGKEQFGYHSVPSFIVGQWKMVCCVEILFRANSKWPGHSTLMLAASLHLPSLPEPIPSLPLGPCSQPSPSCSSSEPKPIRWVQVQDSIMVTWRPPAQATLSPCPSLREQHILILN